MTYCSGRRIVAERLDLLYQKLSYWLVKSSTLVEDFTGKTIKLFDSLVVKWCSMNPASEIKILPSKVIGRSYSNVSAHDYLSGSKWKTTQRKLESHYVIQIEWSRMSDTRQPTSPGMKVQRTSLCEPDCPCIWCNLQHAVKWHGLAEYACVLSAGPTRREFNRDSTRNLTAISQISSSTTPHYFKKKEF